MNKNGMTLIELLVYMAIAALLLAPVIMLMQNSSVNMARDAVTTDLRISGRDILNIMYDDIRNTGFKLEKPEGTVSDSIVMSMKVDPTSTSNPPAKIPDDSSSFRPSIEGPLVKFDTLTIRKGRLKSDGGWDGYDTVMYYVRETDATLIRRSTKFIYNTTTTPHYTLADVDKEWAIARPVEALQFQYSADLENWRDTYYNTNDITSGKPAKTKVKYIKISVVTVDKKKLAPTKTFSQIDVGDYSYGPFDDQYLREVSEIVVPIPNNGLFP
jgi:prepilin-type N-terminal cleavage/methylation domain-containing protein